MFAIIESPNGNARKYTFDKTSIIIGSSLHADVRLSGERLKPEHIAINQSKDGNFYAINAANDPFSTWNGLSFRKKQLNSGDTLQIGKTVLQIEIAKEKEEHPQENRPEQPVKNEAAPTPVFRPVKPELSAQTASYDWEADIADLIKEVEAPPSPAQPAHAPNQAQVVESDEEPDAWHDKTADIKEKQPIEKSWKRLLAFVSTTLLIFCFIGLVIYLRATDKSDVEAIRAARGVSDVSMALTQARLKEIRPQSQNWSDPDFLKSNLFSALGSEFTPFLNLDPHGQFTDCPYLLRIYTNNDLSQFIVIAQPAPSLLQWLVPKHSIVLDSESMQIHKTSDLRTLNRLMAMPHPLEGANALEISKQIRMEELVPLWTLSSRRRNEGFNAPKALGMLRPGAEQSVYNAPRYYPLGESLLNQAIALETTPSTSEDVSLFQQQVGILAKHKDLVLYTSSGLESANAAQKAMGVFAPHNKLLIAYFTYSLQGNINGAHLLIPDHSASSEVAEALPPHPANNDYSDQYQHPVYLKLLAIRQERNHTVRDLADKWTTLFTRHISQPNPHFAEENDAVMTDFLEGDRLALKAMLEKIYVLRQEYAALPDEVFAGYARLAGLESYGEIDSSSL